MPLDDVQNQEIEAQYQASIADKKINKNLTVEDDKNKEIEALYQQSLKTPSGPKGAVETVANWFTGSKSTEFPDMPAFAPTNILSPAYEGQGIGTRLKVLAGAMLTPDLKTQSDIILNQIPGSSMASDKFGNPIIVMPDGKTFYLNKPGADIEDVTQLTSQILQYAPGAGAITKTFAGSLLKRSLAQGAYGGGVSMAQDTAAIPLGGAGVDYGKAAISAVIPFATEITLTPAVNTFFNKFGKNKEFFTVDLNGVPSLTTKGESAAKAAGIDITGLDKSALNKKFTELAQVGETGNPKLNNFISVFNKWKIQNPSAESEPQFGISLTKSQKAGDKPGVATLYKAATGSYGQEVQIAANEFLESQNINIGNAAKNILQRFNKGEVTISDLTEAGEQVMSTVKNNFKKGSDQVKTAYNLVNNDAIYLGGKSNLDVLEASVAKAIQETTGGTVDKTITPSTVYLQGELKAFLDKLKSGATIEGAEKGGRVQYVNPTTFNQFETFKKKIDTLYKSAANNTDRANIMAIKGEFTKFTDDAIDNALFGSGDNPLALEAVKKARQTFQAQQKLYGVNPIVKNGVIINDPAGKVVQKILQDETVTPVQTIDYIFGLGNIGAKKDSIQIVQRLKKIFDAEDMTKPNADLGALKQAVVQRINLKSMDLNTDKFIPEKLVTNWNSLLKKNKELVDELFTKEEQTYITNFVDTVKKTIKPSEKNLEEPISFINRALLSVGAIGAGGVGLQAGSLYGGMAARGLWQRTVDLFHQSKAKRMVMGQLKQTPSLLDKAGEPVIPGRYLADMLNKSTKYNYEAPSLGGTVAPFAQTILDDTKEKKINERPLISLPAAQQGIKKTQPRTEVPILDRNMMTAATTPTAGSITNIPQEQLDKYTSLFGPVV